MNPKQKVLSKAARQLLAIEELFDGLALPVGGPALPEFNQARAVEGEIIPELPAIEKTQALASMDADEIKPCTKCVLSRTRTNTVFGEGNTDADLVFVGEAPGHDEDMSGSPFVGRAGKLLTKMITAMGLSRDDIFICNVIKCRPPNNRTPAVEEVSACWGYLVRQLQIIRPRVIVTLGNPSTKTLLNTTEGITRLRGTWQEMPNTDPSLAGIAVMPTFHPSYVLRRYNAETRGLVWSDLQSVMKLLGLKMPKK